MGEAGWTLGGLGEGEGSDFGGGRGLVAVWIGKGKGGGGREVLGGERLPRKWISGL